MLGAMAPDVVFMGHTLHIKAELWYVTLDEL